MKQRVEGIYADILHSWASVDAPLCSVRDRLGRVATNDLESCDDEYLPRGAELVVRQKFGNLLARYASIDV